MGIAIQERPGGSFPEIFETDRAVKAAYRFIENRHLTLDDLVMPGIGELGKALRVREEQPTVLSIQDTTEFDLSRYPEIRGLGPIGNPECHGLFLHTALATTTTGVPEGLLEVRTWVRSETSRGKARERRKRSFEDKESVKWWETLLAAEEAVEHPGLLVHVMDAEGDIYELFERSQQKYRLLVRASQDRNVEGEHRHLWAELESRPVLGQQRLEVPERLAHEGHAAQRARTANVSLRFGKVIVKAAHGKGQCVEMWGLLLREVEPPSEEEQIEWVLLTNDVVKDVEQAWERVQWYRFRWVIEEFHKCLKTGCRVESRPWKTRDHFEMALAFFLLASIRLLRITKLGRVCPDSPAREFLSEVEETIVRQNMLESGRVCPGTLTLMQAIVAIAGMGGFLGRKSDGYPGWHTLWKGYIRLCDMAEGYRIAVILHEPQRQIAAFAPQSQVFAKLVTFASSNWPEKVGKG